MKHKLLLPLALLAAATFVSGQQITETMLGDSGWNNPQRIWQMPDGNIAVVSVQYNGNYSPVSLFHLSPNGQTLAKYNLPFQSASVFVEPSADGGSFYYGNIENIGYTIRHMNLEGQTLDSIAYMPTEPIWDDFSFDVDKASNGHFVLAIEDQAPPNGVRIVRLNQQGGVVFNKYVSSQEPDIYSNFLKIMPDGRTVLLIQDFIQGNRLVCYSPTGSLLWTKGVPFPPLLSEDFSLVALANGNVAYASHSTIDATGQLYVSGAAVAYKPNGVLAFSRDLSTELGNFSPYISFADGDQFIVAGDYSDQNGLGLGVIKLDANGQTVFAKKFDMLSGDGNITGALSQNGDYVFSGFRWKNLPGTTVSDKGYVLCLQANGDLNWVATGPNAAVRLMNGFCHLNNGDMVVSGQAFLPQLPPGEIRTLVTHISDIGPIYTHLVQGKIVLDSIQDCVADLTEPVASGWIVKAESSGSTRYGTSDESGSYKIRLANNAANVSVEPSNGLWEACATTYPVDFTQNDTVALSIPVKTVANCPFLDLDVSTSFLRRCFDNTYYINLCNNGSAGTENLQLTIELDSFTTYVASSIPLAAQSGQILHFEPTDLAPGNCSQMTLTVHTSCTAPLGTVHCLSAYLETSNNCPNFPSSHDAGRDCQANIGAFDPNDKRAFVDGSLREGYILPNTDIKYQIRFQNTGTDTAFNIVVVDTISNKLNVNTLRLGASSHPCTMQLLGDHVVKFVFNNIQLPDSNINEAASHGFVNFFIAQQTDLPLQTTIENRADIFFDYNDPVGTNRHKFIVNNTTETNAPTHPEANIIAYPNPATSGDFWIDCVAPESIMHEVFICDALGRIIASEQPNRNKIHLILPEPKGIYLVKVLCQNGSWTTIKMVR